MSIMTCATFTPTHVGSTGTALAPRAGEADEVGREIGREDDRSGHNGSGYERDETDTSFRRLVHHLVDDGDDRARSAGRRARRTLGEMAPGYTHQPILRLTRPLPMRAANDACGICGFWICRCGNGVVALTDLVADSDSRALITERRARRTLGEMAPGYDRQPLLRMTTADIVFMASQPCGACGGQGGQVVDTSGDGVSRQHWVTCQACGGSGVAR